MTHRGLLVAAAVSIGLASSACATTEVTPTAPPPTGPEPTATAEPTHNAQPTPLPAPTATPTAIQPTETPVAATAEITEVTEPPPRAAKPLNVTFTALHYECAQECNHSETTGEAWWGYRSFQVLMTVENTSTDLILAGGSRAREGWAPTRWFITNGVDSRVSDTTWQWVHTVDGSRQEPYRRPDLPPGATGEWTWMVFPLSYGEWVNAGEYEDEWGNLYRQGFEKPEPAQYNYVDCGEPREGSC